MIPNPTEDQWLKKVGRKASWKISRLMEVLEAKLRDFMTVAEFMDAEGSGPTHEITAINSHLGNISSLGFRNHSENEPPPRFQDEAELSIHCREAIHDAIDERTKYLLDLTQAELLSVLVAHITKVIDVLADPNSPLNKIVLAHKEDALLTYYFEKVRPVVIGDGEDRARRNTIWISLIFRMLCWLMLHDFDKADVKIVPADLKGSRMPVYIG
jgi:hypothetical protein